MTGEKKKSPLSPDRLVELILQARVVMGGGIDLAIDDFTPSSNLVLITGDNATGKSVVRRIIQRIGREHGVEVISLSQEGRTAGGIMTAMVYGSEQDESTGAISAHTVLTGIKTSRDRKTPHILLFDEPDIGLSDGYAMNVGTKIKELVENPPEHLALAVVVSHRKALVRRLQGSVRHHVRVGGAPDLATWLCRDEEELDLADLPTKSRETYRRVSKILKKE